MVNGNAVLLQVGREESYAQAARGTSQIRISKEGFRPSYNKVEEGLATGGRGSGLRQTMGIKTEGSFSTLMRPDMGILLHAALGRAATQASEGGITHTYTCVGSGESEHLPSLSVYVDRVVEKFLYTGCKVSSLSLSAAKGDYLKCDMDFVGRDEEAGVNLSPMSPSPLRAFKFAQGKVYHKAAGGWEEIADVTSVSVELNNNLDSDTQTTSTGDYYKEPEAGVREVSVSLEMLYASGAEAIRRGYYKSDAVFSVKAEFVSDEKTEGGEPYRLTVEIPCAQASDASANMGGLDTLSQSMTLNAVDSLSDEYIKITLLNGGEDE